MFINYTKYDLCFRQAVTVQQTSVIKTTPKPTEPPAKPDQNGFLGKLNGKLVILRGHCLRSQQNLSISLANLSKSA